MKAKLALVLPFLSLLACKDATSGSPAPTSSVSVTGGSAKPRAAAPTPFDSWDLGAIATKWQGAWVVGGSSLGFDEAWSVAGDKVTIDNGQGEKTFDFEVTSPCSVKTTEKSNGGSSSTESKFAFDGEKLYKGLGQSGLKNGQSGVACVSNFVVQIEATGACKSYTSMFGRWDAKDIKCAWGKADGKDFLTVPTGSSDAKLTVVGNVLLDEQMTKNVATKFPDFAAAKAARAKKK